MSKHFLFSFFTLALLLVAACGEKETVIDVQSIAISQPSAEMEIGETLSLKATVSPSNASYDGMTWTSTNPKVASVSASGLVTALSEGNTTITVVVSGKTASCSVTVRKGYVAVSSISLNKTTLEMVEGDTESLTATVSPDDATDKTVTWTSSNESVAKVKDGAITAVKEGETTISAKAGEKTASCKVIVSKKVIPVASIELSKTELTIVEGDSGTLTATVSPDDATDQTVVWSSSNESIATVKDGVINAISQGEATITAKVGEKTATCKVIVTETSAPVPVLEAIDLGLPSGLKWASFNLGATSPEDYGDYFAWGETKPYYSSHNPLIWKEGKDAGYNWASYKWCNGGSQELNKYCPANKINYWDGIGTPYGRSVLDPDDDAAHVNLGGKWRMPTDEEWTELRKNCSWIWTTKNGVNGRLVTASNGNSIFLPAAGYLFEANLSHVASIGFYWSSSLNTLLPSNALYVNFVSTDVGRYDDVRIMGFSVRPVYGDYSIIPVESISLANKKQELIIGESSVLVATVLPANASDQSASWSSSNTSVATVSSNGVVTGVSAGSAVITVTTTDGGKTATCKVIVTETSAPVPVLEAIDLGLPSGLKWASFNLGATSPEDYGDYFAWGETKPYYSSHNPLIWKEGKDAGYNWASYKWCNGSDYTLTKYCTNSHYGYNGFVDELTVLALEDDAAHICLGEGWRMPTDAEWSELRENCTWTWSLVNGVFGMKVTSNRNGNNLFLPAASWRHSTYLDYLGDAGHYWSSSLCKGSPSEAWKLSFSSTGLYDRGYTVRSVGFSVRPVCD